MIKYFNLADIVIRIKDPLDIPLSDAEGDFLIQGDRYDYDFEFIECESFEDIINQGILIYEGEFFHIYNYKGYELRLYFTEDEKYKVVYYYGLSYIGEKKGYFYYIDEKSLLKAMQKGPNQLLYICFEKILNRFGGLILHSSFIKYNNKAILFSAPSGTGKSTQAELWREYKGAKIINGDRTALRKIGSTWKAYGIPMCGTSNIHVNDKMDLDSIVIIRQYKENIVKKIPINDSFKSLYNEVSINLWDKEMVNNIFDLIIGLASNVPIYFLQCTKQKEAVECLLGAIEGGCNEEK